MEINFGEVERVLNYIFENAKEGDPESVLKAIDDYTLNQEVLMNIGGTKGAEVDKIIQEHKPKVLVELGGYFGYSAVRFANLIKDDPEAHYYSVEFNPVLACVVSKVVQYANLSSKVTVLIGDLQKTLPQLKEYLRIRHNTSQLDFLLIDHEKSAYVTDLELAEREHLLRKGSVVVADNIIFPGAPKYLEYMNTHTAKYTTTQVEGAIKHSNGVIKDAICVSVYN